MSHTIIVNKQHSDGTKYVSDAHSLDLFYNILAPQHGDAFRRDELDFVNVQAPESDSGSWKMVLLLGPSRPLIDLEFSPGEVVFEQLEALRWAHIRENTSPPVPEPKPLPLLEEAKAIAEGARSDVYGHPYDNFKRIADMWTVILDTSITPDQVAQCMIGLKLARLKPETRTQDRDSWLDIAGYVGCLDMIQERRGGWEG